MSRFSVEVFAHVMGVILVFVGYGTLLLTVAAMRRATRSEQLRAITSALLASRRIGRERLSAIDLVAIAGVLLIALTGLDMAFSLQLIREPWIDVAIGSFVLLAPIDPILTMALGGSLGILVGIVFLMTTKPELSTSITAVAIAVVAGMAISWPFASRRADPVL